MIQSPENPQIVSSRKFTAPEFARSRRRAASTHTKLTLRPRPAKTRDDEILAVDTIRIGQIEYPQPHIRMLARSQRLYLIAFAIGTACVSGLSLLGLGDGVALTLIWLWGPPVASSAMCVYRCHEMPSVIFCLLAPVLIGCGLLACLTVFLPSSSESDVAMVQVVSWPIQSIFCVLLLPVCHRHIQMRSEDEAQMCERSRHERVSV